MGERDDGGPAFAALAIGPAGDVYHQPGMTLRDWFAGQALAMCAATHGWPTSGDGPQIAERAYAIADAMLAERSK